MAALPEADQSALLNGFSAHDLQRLEHDWRFWARPQQWPPPGNWQCWLVLAGRGFGKTRMGAEWVRMKARDPHASIALIGANAHDVRQVMVEGHSGLLQIAPEGERPVYEPSKQRLIWPTGARGYLYSAEQPDQLRGPQHSAAWVDELAKFTQADLLWDMLLMGLRVGDVPQVMVTTTPRSIPLLKTLIDDPSTALTRGKTWDNASNLPARFLAQMKTRYSGTRLGAQELEGALLEDIQGALWQPILIDQTRVRAAPQLQRIVIAIDPPVTSHAQSDACGIIAAGICADGQGYILEDLSLERASPDAWARCAVEAYRRYAADRVIAEVNQGGDLVEAVLRTHDPRIAYRAVRAARGKFLRAEPIAALYEQGRVHHVGHFKQLEDEMCSYVAGQTKSPDRLDALVWALTDLMLGDVPVPRIRQL